MDLNRCKVLVTPTSFGKSDPGLLAELEAQVGTVVYNPTARLLSSDELRELLSGCDGFIAGLDKIDRAALESADRLKVIARYGVGVDNVDLEYARQRGIRVTNTPGANASAVAELAIGLMIDLARGISMAAVETRDGKWPRLNGISLEGKTVGLLGFGAIGKRVAERLSGFHARLLAYDPYPDTAAAKMFHVELLPQVEVIRQADFLSLHLPLLPETCGLMNTAFLNEMKSGAFLVNTARGELIDEDALLAALQSGRLKGAALDVFSKEPPGADHPLLALPQVIATPHIGSHTDGAANTMGWAALHDCLAVLQCRQPEHPVI